MMKFPRWIKSTIKWVLFLLVALVSLYVLGCAWYSWSTAREWVKLKGELEARGEKFSLVELLFPPIPDEANFFASPLFKEGGTSLAGKSEAYKTFPLIKEMDTHAVITKVPDDIKPTDSKGFHNLEYEIVQRGLRTKENKDQPAAEIILTAFDKRRDLWELLYKAAEKPGSYFPFEYEKLGDLIAYENGVIELTWLLSLRASANMMLHKPKEAARDVLLIFRLSDAIAAQPLVVTQYVRIACLRIAISNIREGMERHVWTTDELKDIEGQLADKNLIKSLAVSLRGERGFSNQGFSSIFEYKGPWGKVLKGFHLFPAESFLRMNMTSSSRLFQNVIDQLETGSRGINAMNISFPKVPEKYPKAGERLHLLTSVAIPPFKSIITAFAETQAEIDMTRIACVLERYRIALGNYPQSLNQLVPKYIEKLPNDVANAKPYRYRLDAPDKFTLWSVGFDGVDDNAAHPNDIEKGDWVWGHF
ncbi:MAG: type II secretion system protein GspG [Chthoniobacterales bacterium]